MVATPGQMGIEHPRTAGRGAGTGRRIAAALGALGSWAVTAAFVEPGNLQIIFYCAISYVALRLGLRGS